MGCFCRLLRTWSERISPRLPELVAGACSMMSPVLVAEGALAAIGSLLVTRWRGHAVPVKARRRCGRPWGGLRRFSRGPDPHRRRRGSQYCARRALGRWSVLGTLRRRRLAPDGGRGRGPVGVGVMAEIGSGRAVEDLGVPGGAGGDARCSAVCRPAGFDAGELRAGTAQARLRGQAVHPVMGAGERDHREGRSRGGVVRAGCRGTVRVRAA